MKRRKLWYVIVLCTLCFLAAKMTMAQEEAPPPDASQEQGPPPYADQGYPQGAPGQDQGYPPSPTGQPQGYPQQQGPPPGAANQPQGPAPGAARISFLNGEVSTMRGDSGEWVAGIVNAPVMPGDEVATAGRARAEIQLDFANVLRLDQNADVKIVDLSQKHIQLQVASGVVDFTVFKGTEADVEIDTPNMAVHPLGEGVYRIQIDADSQTELTVRKGKAEVATEQGSVSVERGQVIYVRGSDNPEYQMANAAPNDDWDRWNNDRDRRIEESRSWQYANRYYTGAQDLDSYGNWVNTPDYGYVWSPNVGPDWVPYYDGSWTWEPYWGWTWVSYEPWGWAPYHYGRWFYSGNRWCWWPGMGYWGPRPVWAPAYVSFLGFGIGAGLRFGVGLGFGGFASIGWYPLGLFERGFPWWGSHNGYRAVNIANMVNVNNFDHGLHPLGYGRNSNLQAAFSNPNVRRAIISMPANQFGKGMVRGFGRSVDLDALRQGRMLQGTLPVVPTRASLMPGNRLASPSAIPSRGVSNTRMFSRNPVTTRTESFNQRAGQIQQMVRQNPSGLGNYNARQGANSRFGNQGGAAGGGFGAGNRPGYTNSRSGGPNAQGQYGAWQRFASRTPGQASRGFSNNSPYSTTRPQTGTADRSLQPRSAGPQQGGYQGGWQGYSRQNQTAPANRGGGWNAPAPRAQYSAPTWGRFANGPQGQSYGGYGGSRPMLNMNKPIVVQRPTAPRSYGGGGGYRSGGGRESSRPSGGGRENSEGGSGGHSSSYSHGGGGGSHGKR